MDILIILKILWRKKFIILAVPIIAALAAYLFSSRIVQQYKATAQISTGFTGVDQLNAMIDPVNLREAEVKFSNLLTSMNSGICFNLVSYRLILHDLVESDPFHQPSENSNLDRSHETKVIKHFERKLNDISPLTTSDEDFSVMRNYLNAYGYDYGNVRGGLGIRRIPNTDYIQIEFISDNPKLSALGANAYCEEFLRYYGSLKSVQSGESVEFIRQLLSDKKKEMDEKLETLKAFKTNNSFLNVEKDGEAKLSQLSDLEKRRDDIRSKIQELELILQRLNSDLQDIGRAGVGSNAANQQIVVLRDHINKVNEQYITGGSTNTKLLDSLNNMRERLRVLMSTINQSSTTAGKLSAYEIESKIKDTEILLRVERTNLGVTDANIRNVQFNVSGYASKEARVSALQQEVDVSTKEYLEAVNRYNDTKNAMLVSNTLRQILIAAPPLHPELTKKKIIIGLAGFSGLILCLFVIIGLELIDLTIRTPEKFLRLAGLPMIGTINEIDTKSFNIKTYFNQVSKDPDVEMFKSMMRKIRHEIESLNSAVILVTSAKQKEGKSLVILSLAYVLSLINKRVLIIDTNFKSSSLSQVLIHKRDDINFIESAKSGRLLSMNIGEFSEAGEDENQNTYDLVNPTKFNNIFIIGNSGGMDSPAEILSGRNFTKLVESFRTSFDYILLEGAALNDYSDSKELVGFVDSVIAIFSAHSTIKGLDRESINYLQSLDRKFAGAILNRIDSKDLNL